MPDAGALWFRWMGVHRARGWQLTHFAKFPHEDTFGETCFVVSAVSFFLYSLLRSPGKPADG
jgi:hypothetical protein